MIKRLVMFLIMLIGISIFIYPYIFREYNEIKYLTQTKEYKDNISELKEEELKNIVDNLNNYNRSLRENTNENNINDPFIGNQNNIYEESELDKKFKYMDEEIFGYLVIPAIEEVLPIYLGATERHLEKGIAVLEGTSLPIGGEGTHSVISGHRGWAESTLFRYINKLNKGDKIYIYVYGNRLVYEVIGKEIILPDDFSSFLNINPKEDKITLLTCHPFPYMTHRLLVHCTRVQDKGEDISENFKFKINNKLTGTSINNRINYKYLNQDKVNNIWEENRMIFSDSQMNNDISFDEIPDSNENIYNLIDKYNINTIKKINLTIIVIGLSLFLLFFILFIQELIKIIEYIFRKKYTKAKK